MSDYQKSLINDLEQKPPDSGKLLLRLEDKNNYIVHYKNLQFYLKQRMKLKREHRGAGVRTRMPDRAVHPNEHRIQEKRKERL